LPLSRKREQTKTPTAAGRRSKKPSCSDAEGDPLRARGEQKGQTLAARAGAEKEKERSRSNAGAVRRSGKKERIEESLSKPAKRGGSDSTAADGLPAKDREKGGHTARCRGGEKKRLPLLLEREQGKGIRAKKGKPASLVLAGGRHSSADGGEILTRSCSQGKAEEATFIDGLFLLSHEGRGGKGPRFGKKRGARSKKKSSAMRAGKKASFAKRGSRPRRADAARRSGKSGFSAGGRIRRVDLRPWEREGRGNPLGKGRDRCLAARGKEGTSFFCVRKKKREWTNAATRARSAKEKELDNRSAARFSCTGGGKKRGEKKPVLFFIAAMKIVGRPIQKDSTPTGAS